MFLVMMFSCNFSYAPNISEELQKRQIKSKIDSINVSIEQAEDSVSLNTIRNFKFHNFNKEDRKKVRELAGKLRIKELWLYKIIYIESRGMSTAVYYKKGDDKDPSIRCNYRATGLIQFLPSTAIALGTTNAELYKMSVNEQLDYVSKYFELVSKYKRIRSITDLYLAVFSPSSVGLDPSHIIAGKNSKVVINNRGLDTNKDSTITIKDVQTLLADLVF
jgi:hypothetical protein